jgi:hypothetical protein
MHLRLALRLLRRIMKWDEETATKEYGWVRLISRLKYDGYRDYLAGVRFAESLAGWLSQFHPDHRQAAYVFVKERLIYFSPPEIQRLVEQLYPRFVEPRLRRAAAKDAGVASHLVWAEAASRRTFERRRRQVLFIGLSDGARIDLLRRSNAGVLANDQVVLATHIDDEKWIDLGEKLRKDKAFDAGDDPRFEEVYLVDDFTGSGTSFVRRKADGSWTGKAEKFWKALSLARQRIEADGGTFPLSHSASLRIHHYVSSAQAREAIRERLDEIAGERTAAGSWFANVELTEGLLLPEETRITAASDPEMWAISEAYYDHDLFEQLKEHLGESGQTHVRHGYGNSALPVVLEHNCPNNALTLLWAETDGEDGVPDRHRMRPLFPRRHRHS